MDRLEFDELKGKLESDPFVSEAMEAFHAENFLKLQFLSQFPSVEKAAKTLAAIDVERSRVINAVCMLTALPQQDAELKVTQYCRHHKISWQKFYELLTVGSEEIFAFLSQPYV